MNVTMKPVALIATLLLAACADAGTDQPTFESASTTVYQCNDGSVVEASYPTSETAQVVIQGKPIEMASAVSASGARYVGGGWEWWTKGMTEGMLSPLAEGETTASTTGVNCTAS
ncbi:MliC family protein [Parasphingorhabdus sp. NYA22]